MAVRLDSYVSNLELGAKPAPGNVRGERFALKHVRSTQPTCEARGGLWSKAALDDAASSKGLAARMRLLIRVAGSMAVIARRCGFSQGAVRSWRDGQSDISRERCVVLARTFDISLVWLITGEGPMRESSRPVKQCAEPVTVCAEATPTSDGTGEHGNASFHARQVSMPNPRVLAAAWRLLQSYIGLLGGSLDSNERADALAELYEILTTPDAPGLSDRLIAFHAALNMQLRRARSHA